jgi:hypothetical protein
MPRRGPHLGRGREVAQDSWSLASYSRDLRNGLLADPFTSDIADGFAQVGDELRLLLGVHPPVVTNLKLMRLLAGVVRSHRSSIAKTDAPVERSASFQPPRGADGI